MKDWKKNRINVAIQVLPEADGKIKYDLIDEAIKAIKQTGLKHEVCPFETVVECNIDDFAGLLEKIHTFCWKAGTEKMLTNLKIQVNFAEDVAIEDKIEKYR